MRFIEPLHDKTSDLDFPSNEEPDQPGHPPTLISLHSPHEERYERSFTTHWAHSEDSTQSDPSLRLAHSCFGWFCHIVAQLSKLDSNQQLLKQIWKWVRQYIHASRPIEKNYNNLALYRPTVGGVNVIAV